nr:unnamed protein product [Digitaria exilis]
MPRPERGSLGWACSPTPSPWTTWRGTNTDQRTSPQRRSQSRGSGNDGWAGRGGQCGKGRGRTATTTDTERRKEEETAAVLEEDDNEVHGTTARPKSGMCVGGCSWEARVTWERGPEEVANGETAVSPVRARRKGRETTYDEKSSGREQTDDVPNFCPLRAF